MMLNLVEVIHKLHFGQGLSSLLELALLRAKRLTQTWHYFDRHLMKTCIELYALLNVMKRIKTLWIIFQGHLKSAAMLSQHFRYSSSEQNDASTVWQVQKCNHVDVDNVDHVHMTPHRNQIRRWSDISSLPTHLMSDQSHDLSHYHWVFLMILSLSLKQHCAVIVSSSVRNTLRICSILLWLFWKSPQTKSQKLNVIHAIILATTTHNLAPIIVPIWSEWGIS